VRTSRRRRFLVFATVLALVGTAAREQVLVASAQAPLGLSAQVDDPVDPIVLPATEAEFVVEVVNFSAAPVAEVTVSADTPTGTTFDEASTTLGTIESPPQGEAGTMIVNIGTLEPGARAQIRFELGLEAGAGSRLDFEAAVTSAVGAIATLHEPTFVVEPGSAVLRWSPLSLRSGPPSASTPPDTLRVERPTAPLFHQNDFPIDPVLPGVEYRVYRSDGPSVSPSPDALVLSLPGTQQNTGALPGPGFYGVAIVVDGVESGISNVVSWQKGEPTVDRVTIKKNVLTARGAGFDATTTVTIDGLSFARSATVTRGGTKLVQTGRLSNGQSLKRYLNQHFVAFVCFTNANGSASCLPYGPIPSITPSRER
jgi:hypothetical protein